MNDTRTRCRCGKYGRMVNPDYFTKEGFWDVWEWAIKQVWWVEFTLKNTFSEPEKLINYKTFAEHVYKYLKETHDRER